MKANGHKLSDQECRLSDEDRWCREQSVPSRKAALSVC